MRDIAVTRVFEENEKSKALIVCNRGSARSSKSYSIAQLLIQRLTNQHNKSFLITRKTLPSLKITAYKLIIDLLKDYGFYPFCEHNKTDNIIRYGDNYMLFTGIDDIEKIKSSEWSYIWMEEATDFAYNDYQILKMRMSTPTLEGELNQMFLSFNPVDAYHWIKTEVIDKEKNVQDILSTYKDNPFLSREYIDILESLKEQDPGLWKIYGEGEWGVLENLIFSHWDILEKWPDSFDITYYGMDFGFNNPSVYLEVNEKDGELYARERIYESGLTNSQLIEKMNCITMTRSRDIYADSAEPARIEEIYQAGYNIYPAEKSVKDGIDYLKRKKLHIHPESTNLIKELRGYKYKTDRLGHVLDEPVKFADHAIDSLRYAAFSHYVRYEREGTGRIRVI
jgi:phage terminase large subunit